ncbi:MAG: PD-(D/E)XK nuclease family protein [Rikenellaceae bacterium]
MGSFLGDVSQSLVRNFGAQLSDIQIVVPSRRAAIYLKKHLLQLCGNSSVKIFSINDWITVCAEKILGQSSANKYVLLHCLYEAYLEVSDTQAVISEQDKNFENFIQIGEQILSDFDMIDQYLVDPTMLYEYIADLSELKNHFAEDIDNHLISQLKESDSTKKLSVEFLKKWQNLLQLYYKFSEKLSEQKIISEGQRYRKLAECLRGCDEEIPSEMIRQTTVFVGLNALSESEKTIFRAKQKFSDTYFIWDYDTRWLVDDFCEASYFIGKNLREFPQAPFYVSSNSNAENIEVNCISTTSAIMQCKVVKKLLGEQKNQGGTTAIILTDESIAIPLLRSISDETKQLNISIGYPLNYTDAGQLFTLLTSLVKQGNFFINQDFTSFNISLIKTLLAHPLLVDLCSEIMPSIGDDQDCLNKFPALLKLLPPSINSASELCEYLVGVQEFIQGNIVSGEDSYIISKVISVINNERGVLDFLWQKRLSINFIIETLERAISANRVDFQGVSGSKVEVMGILESRTLDFDNIILLGVEEGSFPNPSQESSFIPVSLYPHFNLPTIADKSAIWSYYFYRLLTRSKAVSLLYSNVATLKSTGEPSRYIQQIKHSSHYNVIDSTALLNSVKHLNTSDLMIAKTDEHIAILRGLTLSPSSLSIYLNCPLAFYFRYIESIRVPDVIEDELTARENGLILHDSLAELYSPFLDKKNVRSELSKITQNQIVNAVDEASSKYVTNPKLLDSQALVIMKQEVAYLAKSIINFDKGDSSEMLSKLLFVESQFYGMINGVKFGGIVDRIDLLSGDILRIIDYKSGAPELKISTLSDPFSRHYSQDNPQSRPAVLQLLIYCYIMSESSVLANIKGISPVIFTPRNKQSVAQYISVNSQIKSVLTQGEILIIKDELASIIEEMLDIETSFVPCKSTKNCTYCHYAPICSR